MSLIDSLAIEELSFDQADRLRQVIDRIESKPVAKTFKFRHNNLTGIGAAVFREMHNLADGILTFYVGDRFHDAVKLQSLLVERAMWLSFPVVEHGLILDLYYGVRSTGTDLYDLRGMEDDYRYEFIHPWFVQNEINARIQVGVTPGMDEINLAIYPYDRYDDRWESQ